MQQAPAHFRPGPHDGISRRNARLLGWSGFVAAGVGPALIWREAIRAVATDFSWELDYLVMGWTGYALIVIALLFMLPVLVSIGRFPGDRFYPRSRNAYIGWAITLYLLGCMVAAQVASITSGLSHG